MSDVAAVLAGTAVGYLLGTFPSADVVCGIATRGRVDLRTTGSGNPGGLNAMKVIGKRWGALVIVVDAAKGAAAGFVGLAIGGDAGAYSAATAAIGGHIWPVWSRFRGGKGVATSAGSCLAVFPAFFPIDAAVALITAVGTRRPELTMWISCSIWVTSATLWWAADLPHAWGPEPSFGLLLFAVVGALMILGKFRAAAVSVRALQ